MKHLFLIRHGKSSWSDPALEDWERPLNKRGKRQLGIMAPALQADGAFDGLVFASNAMRARQTIEGLIETLDTPDLPDRVRFKAKLYTFSGDVLFRWLQQRREPGNLTLVGHNPALLDLANTLLRRPVDALPTGSAVHLMLPIQHWSELEPDTAALASLLLPHWVSYAEFQRKQPEDPARKEGRHSLKALGASLQHLLDRLQTLEPGARRGDDPEFLHQYRIAIRKTRAVLETLYQLTGDKALKKPVRQLKQHARSTSALRDLDVFLGTLEQWSGDPAFAEAIAASAAVGVFRAQREAAQTAFARHLDSCDYLDDRESLQAFVRSERFSALLGDQTRSRIREALDARIADHNARLVALSDLSPDDDFHRLRKCLKRIRYLADMDRGLPKDFRKDLKARQGVLGDFQDRHVQEAFMQGYQQRAENAGMLTPLIERLTHQKQATRQRILTLDVIEPPAPVLRASGRTAGAGG